MKIEVHNRVSDFNSYRAARVKSLFNAESGCNFDLEINNVDLSGDWNIGVVVGASGSGKTSIGKMIFGENKIYDYTKGWSPDKPIIDDIIPEGDFNEVTGGTIYKLTSECDKGDILLQKHIFINQKWDYHKLWEKLFPIGVDLICEAVQIIESGNAEWIKQDEQFATWEPSWNRPRLKRNELIQLQ